MSPELCDRRRVELVDLLAESERTGFTLEAANVRLSVYQQEVREGAGAAARVRRRVLVRITLKKPGRQKSLRFPLYDYIFW